MSIAEGLAPFALFAIIAVLVVMMLWPRGHGHRPFHGTHLDGDEN